MEKSPNGYKECERLFRVSYNKHQRVHTVRSHINVMNVERPLPLFTVPTTSEEPHW